MADPDVSDNLSSERLPDVASVGFTAPLSWLSGGWADFRKAPLPCLIYGLGLALISAAIVGGVLFSGHANWVMILTGGFFFIAPMLAMGLYEAGRQLEFGVKPRLSQMLLVKTASAGNLAVLGLALFLVYLLWTRAASVVYGLSTFRAHETVEAFVAFAFTDPEGLNMTLWGTLIGGAIAFVAFCFVVVSAPMLLDRKSDIFIATATSFRAVFRNFGPLLFWAVLIVALTLLGIATACIGLIVIFPVLGLASWRAYRDMVPGRAVSG